MQSSVGLSSEVAVANVPTLTSPKNVSGNPKAEATISIIRLPSLGEVVAPAVLMGVTAASPVVSAIEPTAGAAFRFSTSPAPNFDLAAANAFAPPFTFILHANRAYALVIVAQSSRNSL